MLTSDIIGQNKLKNIINTYTIDNFPRSVLFLGEAGIGKHTFTNYISQSILSDFQLFDITELISKEFIDKIYENPNPGLYVIDLSKVTEKEQNIILKFVEEPLSNTFIILLGESRNSILNTILNRCVVFEFEAYSNDELRHFLQDPDADAILEVFRTPGKIKASNPATFNSMMQLADKMAEKIINASYQNTLTIANKINFKDDYDKFDLELFIDCLQKSLFSHYLSTNSNMILNMFYITRDFRKTISDSRLNKQMFFENYLTKLWKLSRGL